MPFRPVFSRAPFSRGFRAPFGAGFSGVLDGLSVEPILFLSTKRVTGTSWGSASGVDDPMARIRESGANDEQSFSYTGENELDHAAIQTFIGANDGFWQTWYDQSGSGNDAVQATTGEQPAYVDDLGPDFDGTDDLLVVAHQANHLLTSGLSIAVWMRRDEGNLSNFDRIVHKADGGVTDGFLFYSRDASRVGTQINTTAQTLSDGDFVVNQWQQAVVTIDGDGNVAFYQNNTSAGSGTTSPPSQITTTVDMTIGARAGDNFIPAEMDHLLVTPGVMSSADIQAHFDLGSDLLP